MKQRFDKSVGGLVIIGVPLLLVTGCAAEKANLAQIDPRTPQVEKQVKTVPDEAAVPAEESTASPAKQTTPQLGPAETANESAVQAPHDAETIALPETQAAASPQPASHAIPEVEASAPSEVQASTPAAETVAAANDKPSPTEEATAPLPQHAEYLLAHPEYNLLITGHADNRGPKAYNQRLSGARARKVEQLLEADGVPKQQLRIKAMGATSPMVDPADYRQNRRVEFIYQDAVVAKGK